MLLKWKGKKMCLWAAKQRSSAPAWQIRHSVDLWSMSLPLVRYSVTCTWREAPFVEQVKQSDLI